ncbi:MAG TPA: hypothetical protein VLE53_07355 [Gemmatimonadaceae bacterium]|nr:hypothetical protein [Gemmatimonadaceae bacterium]
MSPTPRWFRRAMCASLATALLSCGDTTEPSGFGRIQVFVVTSGDDLDPDGYVVTVDALEQVPIGATGTTLLTSVPSGRREVGLENVAENCEVLGAHPAIVTVARDRSLTVHLSVRCRATGVQVTVSQIGFDPDGDGFTLLVNGAPVKTLHPGVAVTHGGLEPGSHTVSISGVAANCTVEEPQLQTVTVTRGAATMVHFTVTCQATTGTVRVTVETLGEDFDPDGYVLHLEGGHSAVTTPNGVAHFARVAPGSRTVRIDGVVSTCQVLGDSEQTVDVVVGATAELTFRLSCTRTEVIAFTRGYNGEGRVMIVHANGAGPVTLAHGVDAVWSPDGRHIAFRHVECDPWGYYYYYSLCYVAGLRTASLPDWSLVEVTNGPDGPADWSPDGALLVFARAEHNGSRLHTVRVDGGGLAPLRIDDFGEEVLDPVWSPDGRRIAFACRNASNWDVCVVNVDGSGFRRLTNDAAGDFNPAWSPDGSQIAFTTDGPRIAVIAADGTGRRDVTGGQDPSWSPDGTRLVFVGIGAGISPLDPGLYLVNVDGSGLVRLTADASDRSPSWRR